MTKKSFSREDYEEKFKRMWELMEETISLFKSIIEDERIRSENLTSEEVIQMKDATRN